MITQDQRATLALQAKHNMKFEQRITGWVDKCSSNYSVLREIGRQADQRIAALEERLAERSST